MIASFTPHFDILPKAQRALWPLLAALAPLGYVLYGGTAVALRLGHRISVDFDFFSHNPVNRQNLFDVLPALATARVLQDEKDTFTAETSGSMPVKISFFGGLDFGRVGAPEQTADGVVHVASLTDLMSSKLKVIFQRIEAKDYRDIAAMIHAGNDLATGLAASRALYGLQFQPSECLKALTWFQGGDLVKLTALEKSGLIAAASAVKDLPAVQRVSNHLSYSEIQE
jgi:Nucleotidyl transferase AbiEii toxin, Type IV TA system